MNKQKKVQIAPLKDEVTFAYEISTIIAADVLKQYAGGLATMYKDKRDNHKRNRITSIEKDCQHVMNMLNRELKPVIPHIESYIEDRMQILYDVVGLPSEDQKRVINLIRKIKSGK